MSRNDGRVPIYNYLKIPKPLVRNALGIGF